MINDVRTIKITDTYIYATQSERMLMETKHRRDETMDTLNKMLANRQEELSAEERKAMPDYVRISKLRSVIRNLQSTIKNAQR